MYPKPDFERLLTALTCKGEPDRVPLVELGVSWEVMGGFLGRKISGWPDIAEFYTKADYDYLKVTPMYDFNPEKRTPKEGIRSSTGKFSANTEDDVSIKFATEGSGIITTWEDFETYPWVDLKDVDYSVFDRANEVLPPGMKIIGHQADIFTQLWGLMGFETFSYASVEEPELVEQLTNKIGEIVYGMFEVIAEQKNVGALWISDDIAYTEGLMVSPAFLREHIFPWYKKIGNLARDLGVPYMYHSDGDLWQVMPDLIDDIGFNALHPIEPKGMEIGELKRKIGDRVCLIGNIDLGYTLTRGTPAEVEEEVKQRIREIGPGGGYCVGSSNSIPNYVPVENYRAMVESALKYGAYPISV
ncbi:MAG TPA: uroporphyrinogen decarboxylase family protein [Armatimonadota bacterium]|nr:uroporphyrinogen decarboxylase family protein [Armatimonadota bacterium]